MMGDGGDVEGVEELAADGTGGIFFCILGRGVWGGGRNQEENSKLIRKRGIKSEEK